MSDCEMPIIDGIANPDDGHTLLHPPTARMVENRFGKFSMPHRYTNFRTPSTSLNGTDCTITNTSLKINNDLSPDFEWDGCPTVKRLKEIVEQKMEMEAGFINFANLNVYPTDGKAKLNLHRDHDMGEAVGEYIVQTLSLGGNRKYRVVPDDPSKITTCFILRPGSVNCLGRRTNSTAKHEMMVTRAALDLVHVYFYL